MEITIPKHILSKTGFSVTFVNTGYTKISLNLICVKNAKKGKTELKLENYKDKREKQKKLLLVNSLAVPRYLIRKLWEGWPVVIFEFYYF